MQLLATIIPSIILVYIFYTFDKFPEPKKYIIITFILGILIAIPACFLNVYLSEYLANNMENTSSSFYFLLGFLVSMFNSWFISAPFYIFVIVLWGFGFINALQGVSQPVPLVGKKFQQWFTFIQ